MADKVPHPDVAKDANALEEKTRVIQKNFALLVGTLLQKEGLSPYALSRRLRGVVSQRSVYDFLEGKDTRLKTLLAILEACELEIGVGQRTPRLLNPRQFTKDRLIDELRRMEERKSIGHWLNDLERSYYHRWLKTKWAEYEKQRITQKRDDESTAPS